MMENRPDEGAVAATVRDITERIAETCAKCGRDPADVRLMAVTKTVEAARVNEAIGAGVRLLGENRAQELLSKYDDYRKDGVEIHFIGHLQTNKVRQIADKVTMIQSLDSLPLARGDRKTVRKAREKDGLPRGSKYWKRTDKIRRVARSASGISGRGFLGWRDLCAGTDVDPAGLRKRSRKRTLFFQFV